MLLARVTTIVPLSGGSRASIQRIRLDCELESLSL